MNRDIIKEFDIKYRVNSTTQQTESYIDLRVAIDDVDFDAAHGAYIEDIKLYNQNTFVNPTNVNDGISIFSDLLYSDKKIDKYQLADNDINKLFKKNTDTPQTIENNYKLNDEENDYEPLVAADLTTPGLVSYNFINRTPEDGEGEEVGIVYYYKTDSGTYSGVDYEHRHQNNFYTLTNKTKVYEYKDLQDDAQFKQNFDLSNDIIIISVKIHPHPSDTCQSDYIIKVLYNKLLFKNDIIAAIDEIGSRCVIPMRLIDFFLRMKAFEIAAETGDVEFMCRFMKMFNHARGLNGFIEYAPCGCLRH